MRLPSMIGSKIQPYAKFRKRIHELGLPFVRSFLMFLHYYVRYGYSVDNFLRYELYSSKHTKSEKLQYVPSRMTTKLWETLNPPRYWSILTNKYVFHCMARANGLPVPELYGVFDVRNGFDVRGESLRSLADLERLIEDFSLNDFVIKPVEGKQGMFVYALSRTEEKGGFNDIKRGRCELSDVCHEISDERKIRHQLSEPGFSADFHSFLVQERLGQHPELERFAGPALTPVRLVTLVDNEGGISILTAQLLILDHMVAKNANDPSGIVCRVDAGTGEIVDGVNNKGGYGKGLEQAPSAREPFAGKVCPFWQETVETVLRAAQRFSFCRSIGWDVAITSDGPYLLEGNARWGFTSPQLCQRRGIYDGALKDTYESLANE